ncbi:hypothetical protein BH20ACT23_BH20ACT23_08880 [soil metagenome]
MAFPSRLRSRLVLTLGLATVAALVLTIALVQVLGEGTESNVRPTAGPTPKEAPNILIFVTDDQRAESMEAMPRTSKYFMDEGAWFPNALSTTPLCCPARASIFTGRFVHNHGVRTFTPYELDQDTTLQAALQANGYRTGFFGKYLNFWLRRDDPPFFDDWAIFSQSNATTYKGNRYNTRGKVVGYGEYSTHLLRDLAHSFLEQGEVEKDTRPWLMYISTPAAHLPYVAEERFSDASVGRWKGNEAVFEEDLSDKPRWVREPERGKCDFKCGRNTRRRQHRTLMSVDVMIDAVMTKLEELDQADDTLSIFVSDHGLMWGEHGLGYKRFPFKQVVNVPFGIRAPGEIEPGVDTRLASTVDIAPTVLDAAGVESEVVRDGRSLLDHWRRKEMLIEHWPSTAVPGYRSLWSDEYQYTEYYNRRPNRITHREYFDLEEDPWQLENLLSPGNSEARPERRRLERFSRRLDAFGTCEGRECP